MRVALIHDAKFPVQGYGGTERLVWWIAKGLKEEGASVVLVASEGSQCPYAEVFPYSRRESVEADVLHYFNTPAKPPPKPYVVTIGGNGKAGETYSPNTIFVSADHAIRHGAEAFVYNGIDPDDYSFSSTKEKFALFLAKAAWRAKNVKGARRIARKAGAELHILGGSRWFLPHFRGVHWEGMVDGPKKVDFLKRAGALLFPVEWNEPFGIAVVEALVSGTPVIASRRGSLRELVVPEVGVIGESEAELVDGLKHRSDFKPQICRDYAISRFHYRHMARSYIRFYERVIRREKINSGIPQAHQNEGRLRPLS